MFSGWTREKRTFELTHDLYFESSSRAVALSVASDAGVGGLIGHTIDVLDDQGSVGKDFLLAVYRQYPGVALPDDALDGMTGDRTGHAERFPGDDCFFVHVTDERKTVDVEAS